jgi:hypothetical protein
VRVRLPAGGSLVMTSLEESLGSERSTPGELVLRLSTQPGAMHRLDVSLEPNQIVPLSFQIMVAGR